MFLFIFIIIIIIIILPINQHLILWVKLAPAPVDTNHNHNNHGGPTFPVRLAPRGIPTATSRRSPSPLNSPGFNIVLLLTISLHIFVFKCLCKFAGHGLLIWFYQLLLNSQGRSHRPRKIVLKTHNLSQCSAELHISTVQCCYVQFALCKTWGLPSWVIDWFLGLRKLNENVWPDKEQ